MVVSVCTKSSGVLDYNDVTDITVEGNMYVIVQGDMNLGGKRIRIPLLEINYVEEFSEPQGGDTK